jgi:hypothetical protein
MNIHWSKAVVAGLIGTVAITVVGVWIGPLMGIPPMNPAEMLAGVMGGVMLLGWIAHFMIGTILAVIYALVAAKLPGPPVARGALYGLAPWLVAQVMVMPIMGMPLFSGSAVMAVGSLLGHLVYGAVIGGIYGAPQSAPRAATPASHHPRPAARSS